MALEKMRYDADTGTVIYRSKMHLGLKRNFQVLPAPEAQFAARGNRRCESTILRTQGAACSTARGQSRAGRLRSAECVAVG